MLKISNIIATYTSKIFWVNIAQCSLIAIFMKSENFRFVRSLSWFILEIALNCPFSIYQCSFAIIARSQHIFMISVLAFWRFFIVLSILVNCKQTDNCFRLLTYPLQVSSATECLKVTLSVPEYYHSYSQENKVVKSSSIDLLRSSTSFQYRLLCKLYS